MRSLLLALIIGVALLIATCAPPNADDPPMTDPTHTMAATDTMDTMDASSPFFTESPLPYHVPPFDQIDDAHYLPAFEQGMAQQLAEVDAILNSPEAPTFENTLVALEQSGRLLDRVATTFFNLASANTNDAMDEIRTTIAPRLAAHTDHILLDAGLFERVEILFEQRDALRLDAESRRLLEEYRTDFVRAAEGSDAGDQRRAGNAANQV